MFLHLIKIFLVILFMINLINLSKRSFHNDWAFNCVFIVHNCASFLILKRRTRLCSQMGWLGALRKYFQSLSKVSCTWFSQNKCSLKVFVRFKRSRRFILLYLFTFSVYRCNFRVALTNFKAIILIEEWSVLVKI